MFLDLNEKFHTLLNELALQKFWSERKIFNIKFNLINKLWTVIEKYFNDYFNKL